MKKVACAGTVALFMLIFGTCLLHAQGLYFETMRSGKDVPSTKVSYMPGMAKVVTRSGQVILVRVDKKLINILNPGRKTYTEITFDDLEKKQFASLTPVQRRMVEEHIARQKKEESEKKNFDVEKTDETRTIDGFKCTKYVLKKEGRPSATVWTANDIKVADDFHKDAEKLLDPLESAVGVNDQFADWVNKVDGFPILIEGHGTTTRITHIKQDAIPESQFQVPSGYTRASDMRQGGANGSSGSAQ